MALSNQLLDASVAKGRAALEGTTDEHLMTPWRFLVGGKVASENLRHIMLSDAVFRRKCCACLPIG